MFRVFFAVFAIFLQFHFFLVLDFVFAREIVLTFADLANQCKQDALFFFSHMRNYTLGSRI